MTTLDSLGSACPPLSSFRIGRGRGKVALTLVVYLPGDYGTDVQWKVKGAAWVPFPPASDGLYRVSIPNLKPHDEIRCRYRDTTGALRPIAPVGAVENLNGRYFVPAPIPENGLTPQKTGYARVCLEATLEGLIAGYEQGARAPGEIQDLLANTVAARMLRSKLPQRIAALEIDDIMCPVFPAVADRAKLNPKFNYLVYTIGEVDWQLGTPAEFRSLVDAFQAEGISLIPDMIFAHFVKAAHPTALDAIMRREGDGKRLYVDEAAYPFRDYGTWMFDLANPMVRAIIVAQLAAFVRLYGFSAIRIDFVDGILLQYSNRAQNAGELLLRELAAALRAASPDLTIIGEAFSTADAPAVRGLIDIAYMPRGFPVAEEIYKPPHLLQRPLFPDVAALAETLRRWSYTDRHEAVYAQLHDEAWHDEHIARGRPHVPWAYGAHPAQLALRCGEALVAAGELSRRSLLDFVRRRVRGAEAFTMFLSTLRYLYLPSVDSLALGTLDEPGRWKVSWDDPTPADLRFWRTTGLRDKDVFKLHDQHRLDMRNLRAIFRAHSPVDEERRCPLTSVEIFHVDAQASVIGLLRRDLRNPQVALVAIFNFGGTHFSGGMVYQPPLPPDLRGSWRVLFDGEAIAPEHRSDDVHSNALPVGHELRTGRADFSNGDHFLRFPLGAHSLIVLTRVSS